MRTSITDPAITDPVRADPVDPDPVEPDPVDPATPLVEVTVECGPAVDAPVPLAPGRHVIGRARGAAIRIADVAVEPHHALLDVSADGTVAVARLAGRTPLLDGDRPLAGSTRLVAGSTITIGATRLRIGPPSPDPVPVRTGAEPGHGGDRWMVLREPRAVPLLAIAAVEPPVDEGRVGTHGSHPGMLVGALAGVTGGFVMAVVTGSSTVLLLGIVASVASFATWFVSRVRHIRELRRRRRRRRDDVAAFDAAVTAAARRIRTHHEDTLPGVGRRLVEADGRALWGRRAAHGDAFTVSLGRGDIDRPVPIAGDALVDHELLAIVEPVRTLNDVEVPVRLDAAPRTVVAVEGPGAHAIIRSFVVQLAISTGPADWCGRAIVRDPDRCAWVARLPHATVGDARSSVVGADDAAAVAELVQRLDDGDDRRVVVVCDAPALLATRTSPLRRLLDGDRPVTVLLAVSDGSGLPAVCGSVLRTGAGRVAHWTSDLHDGTAAAAWAGVRVRPAGITHATAERVARRLERFVDPEDPSAGAGRLPRELRLGDLPGVVGAAADVVEQWAAGGDDPAPAAVIGTSADGVIELDLVRDGPHGLVAGTTGSGKSELLRTLVVQLATRVDPRHLSLVLVDYKGGSTFDACAELPHVVGLVTDLDGGLAARALTSLEAELHRRERILRDHRAADLTTYRSRPDVDPLPRLAVVIDEFAALAKELPDFLAALVGVAQRGRSLGIHLLLATQRPAGVVDDAVRANTNLRIALRLHDAADAMDVVGDRTPAAFPRGLPGRAVMRLGPDEVVEFQAAGCTGPATSSVAECSSGASDDVTSSAGGTTELAALVDLVREAASAIGFTASHRPWLPSLDEVVAAGATVPSAGAVGWVDDPAAQAQWSLRWERTGNLALVGALGSGTTTTLVALAAALVEVPGRPDRPGPPAIHVIDGRGDAAIGVLGELPTCSGVIGVDDAERVDRLLGRLCDEIDRRRRDGVTRPGADGDGGRSLGDVLLVDGFEVLRRSLDDADRVDIAGTARPLDRLHRVLGEGPSVGIVTAAAISDGAGASAAIARFHERWVFHLDDPGSGPVFGVPATRVPAEVVGRLVIASSGLEAQVHPAPRIAPATGSRQVAPIETLAPVVAAADLGPVEQGSGVAIGRRYDDLGVARFEMGLGDRVVIAGARRTGRSTLLQLLVDAWRRDHPDGVVTTIVPGRPIPEVADDVAPHLVAVDDADRVDDVDGVLARLARCRSGPGVPAMIVSGRADVLRAYDHWAAGVRRDRCGFVMAGTAELDADVLGTPPPRRIPIPPRPGLAWMIAHGDCTLVQIAT